MERKRKEALLNIVVSSIVIVLYICGIVSIALAPKAGYDNVTRSAYEIIYLFVSVADIVLEIVLLVLIGLNYKKSFNGYFFISILITYFRDIVFGTSILALSVYFTSLESAQRNDTTYNFVITNIANYSQYYGAFNYVPISPVYLHYNYGAFAAASAFGISICIVFMVHLIVSYYWFCLFNTYLADSAVSLELNSYESYVQTSNLRKQSSEYIEISLRTLETIEQHQGHMGGIYSTFNITRIEKVTNPFTLRLYENRKNDILKENNNEANEYFFFHGSPYAQNFIIKGFDERYANEGGMFGSGIYFAEHSSKSNQYVGPCSLHQNISCYSCERILLYCRVCLGREYRENQAIGHKRAPDGYHSVVATETRFPEYVVYMGDQAYPEYVIRYKLKL